MIVIDFLSKNIVIITKEKVRELEKNKKISMAVVRRLPKYYRYIGELKSKEISRVSSNELSELTGFTASQIRQDFNNFGGFGQQGYGYNVEELESNFKKILGLNKMYNAVIIGAGNLGQAIANYSNFEKKGFKIIGIFEKNPKMIGMKIREILVYDIDTLEDFIEDNIVDIGIITTPKETSQEVANNLVDFGIKAIWNFAPLDIKVKKDIVLENVNLSESLLSISFQLNEKLNNKKKD